MYSSVPHLLPRQLLRGLQPGVDKLIDVSLQSPAKVFEHC